MIVCRKRPLKRSQKTKALGVNLFLSDTGPNKPAVFTLEGGGTENKQGFSLKTKIFSTANSFGCSMVAVGFVLPHDRGKEKT